MNDHDQPLALREMTPEEARAHYQAVADHLRLVRAKYAGVLNRSVSRLLVRSQLAARVALTDLEGRR